MNIFDLHASVVADYRDFVRSFFIIAADRVRACVERSFLHSFLHSSSHEFPGSFPKDLRRKRDDGDKGVALDELGFGTLGVERQILVHAQDARSRDPPPLWVIKMVDIALRNALTNLASVNLLSRRSRSAIKRRSR